MLNKDNKIISVGLDDTVKAVGRKFYDVKTDHITVSGLDQSRKILTTGYSDNIKSHRR